MVSNPAKHHKYVNPLMHNVQKCCKIFKVCLTILGHYAGLNQLEKLGIFQCIFRCTAFVVN